MTTVNAVIAQSWLPQLRYLRGDLGSSLGIDSNGLSVNGLVDLLLSIEERAFPARIDSDALHGEAHLTLRSNGSYEFRGYMRATGFPSFHYNLQVFVDAPGARVAMQTEGRVFGTDTPGKRQRDWRVTGTYAGLRDLWPVIRQNAQLSFTLNKELSGVTSGLIDVATLAANAFTGGQLFGPIGAVIVLAAEAGSRSGVTIGNPNVLAGLTVGSGVLLLCGPSGLIPALAAGATTAALTQVSCRRMNQGEIDFAARVFGPTLPVDRIMLTNLYHPMSDNGIQREFVYPAFDGSIQVNLGPNYDAPLGKDRNNRTRTYPAAGEVFIHELVHAWQVKYRSFMPGFICEGIVNRNYGDPETLLKRATAGDLWGSYSVEQQASMVDQWYGAHAENLESSAALTDPRFEYITDYIRRGRT